MDDFESEYKSAVEAGQSNLRAKSLLKNWCFHAEFVRSAGRGMIEEATGLPIGHMGVQCKFSKKNSMFCWLLEDAAYDFYQSNCKGCKERTPVGIPNILEFVQPREQQAEKRKQERQAAADKRLQDQTCRRQERAELRHKLTLEETFVLDLVDEIDQEDLERNDPRLEQLANLAPETFTRNVVEHLLPAATQDHLPYSTAAAKALLKADLKPEEKLSVAVSLVTSFEDSQAAVDLVLSDADQLSPSELSKVLRRFVSMAVGPPPGMHIGGGEPVKIDTAPVRSLFQKRHGEICVEISTLLNDTSPGKVGAAAKTILAIDCAELYSKHARSTIAKLMRRRTLLPDERRDSSVLYYLRETASKCFSHYPEDADEVIQSLLEDKDDTGEQEAYRTYRSALKHGYREKVQIGAAQRIAFRRLLWAAVENPEESMDDAGQFFRHSWDEFAHLAAEQFNDLIGAAATLSERYEQVDASPSLELADTALAQMDRSNKRTAIDSLQGALIEWAAVGAKSKGAQGIEEFLELYRQLPEDQTQMRGNMIVHVSKLLTGVESLNLVLSDWYRALMDESAVVRASAAQAWDNVPYDLVKNIPDLFFQTYSALLTDPYIIVHRSAVRALLRRSFPRNKRKQIGAGLWNLVLYYSNESNRQDFLVECIDALAGVSLSDEEKKGKIGGLLAEILLNLEDSALYHAVDRLHYSFSDVPGFVKVALKAIQSDYTRSISIDDCVTTILRTPENELQNCLGDIEVAFQALAPHKPECFIEALLYAHVLTKAGDHRAARDCFAELLEDIPREDRNELWRLEVSLVGKASAIEHAIGCGESPNELIDQWSKLQSDLEKENEERAKLREFPPSFFREG